MRACGGCVGCKAFQIQRELHLVIVLDGRRRKRGEGGPAAGVALSVVHEMQRTVADGCKACIAVSDLAVGSFVAVVKVGRKKRNDTVIGGAYDLSKLLDVKARNRDLFFLFDITHARVVVDLPLCGLGFRLGFGFGFGSGSYGIGRLLGRALFALLLGIGCRGTGCKREQAQAKQHQGRTK